MPGATSDDELNLRRSSSSYHSPWTASLISSSCRTHGSNNLSLRHSFDWMSSPIDYIFMKSLDKCVVIITNILSFSRILIKFMRKNTILPLDDLCYHRQHSCLPQHKLVHIILEIHPIWHVDGLWLSPSATPSSFPCWNCMTYFIICSDGSFVYPKSDLSLMTMSTLSRSMCVVLRSSSRTLGAQC